MTSGAVGGREAALSPDAGRTLRGVVWAPDVCAARFGDPANRWDPEVEVTMALPSERSNDTLLPDLPGGPLCAFRARASFSWRQLALFLESESELRLKKAIFSTLENDPLFARPCGGDLSMEKYRELSFLRYRRIFEYDFLSMQNMLTSPLQMSTFISCLGMYDWSLATKFFLSVLTFGSAIYSSGSKRHLKYILQLLSMEIFGCFALTELSHGSNTKAIRTTAHYDPATEEFIIHSPDFEAAKFWIGNLGKTATHALVFAQLCMPGGQCHGLHAFVVQIRDPKTLLPMPGVMVGDLGKKLGQNGLDNGFAMFHKVRIPRQDLLNRTGDVTPEGTYVTPFKQWRLLPYLAAAYALDHFSKSLFVDMAEFYRDVLKKNWSARQAELGREIHALTSAGKPLASWTAQRGIQECREACGGHGYLAMNRLGNLRDDNDPNCTYEGDNNVLLQQTSNYLLGLWARQGQGGARFESPLKTVNFLEASSDILGRRFEGPSGGGCLDSSVPLAAYEWLVCYLLQESHQKLDQEKRSGKNDFDARNNCQVYYCRSLALAFLELTVVRRFHAYTHQPSVPPSLRAVLGRLSALYALWSLSQHTALLYRGGYFSGEQAGKMIENAILDLCSQLKDDAVALVDVIAPPDFVLDSPIGRADGQLYRNLWSGVLQQSQVLERASWWAEVSTNKSVVGSRKAKL
ncbi:peroxisomal acyl-coenzyme A oxidase 3 isoform X5 [Manis pentadactyla]|uniref:peroxisomal acyl-coenzyme A oxidase 3 isoform X5 n=1 Tax=Manis pentadactyla TaxID=143292 RepID=UPI00255C32C7|nr:peroxisomal acyl-coenzyme A oxidase 3 isoform X5 [Manis pentadactyla]